MRKTALIAFSFLLIGFLFGVLFGRTNEDKAQDVKSAVSKITPTQELLISEALHREKELYEVVKVIDGDTITVNIDGKIETIRLIGIDSPESVDPRKPVQCFGKEASDKAREVLMGKRITIELDPTQGDKDKYKRYLFVAFKKYIYFQILSSEHKFVSIYFAQISLRYIY